MPLESYSNLSSQKVRNMFEVLMKVIAIEFQVLVKIHQASNMILP